MFTLLKTLAGVLLMLTATADAAAPPSPKWDLSLWPDEAQSQLVELLESASLAEEPFVVFDADNTLWQHDLEEALMPFLEQQGLLSLGTLDPAIKPIPTLENESLWNYYLRLCELDDSVCYLWIAQVFSDIELGVLRTQIGELFASTEPIQTSIFKNGGTAQVLVERPRVFAAQAQLIAAMKEAGIEVWIVSAALEELVRMVASDPKYGLNVLPEQVVGVNLLIKQADGSTRISAHDRKTLRGLGDYFDEKRLRGKLTPHLFAPATWYEGKVAGIRTWIHPTRSPIFVAGDALSDASMLFLVDHEAGGRRVWVRRKESYYQRLKDQAALRDQEVTPEFGWLVMRPAALHAPKERSD